MSSLGSDKTLAGIGSILVCLFFGVTCGSIHILHIGRDDSKKNL